MVNPRILRVQSKLEELFSGKIDLTDIKHPNLDNSEFYSRAVAALAVIMRCGIDTDVASTCITDGYCDMGIDAIYNDTAQKKLVLVQSKWRKDGTGGISQEEAAIFAQGIKRIIFSEFEGCNEKIISKQADIISALKDSDYQVEGIFCHTGNQSIANYSKRPISDLLKQVNEDGFSELLTFTEFKFQDIYEHLASGQMNENIVLDDVLLNDWGTVDEPYKAYYGTIPASALGTWYQTYGNRLFAKNIRYYKGSSEVNQGIKDVLHKSPEKFFYYNNGVKILCHKVTRKAAYSADRSTGLFALEGVSVINGAQTTGSIGAVYKEDPEATEKAKVLVQIISLNEAGEQQATQITRLSNTQNKIDGKDFVALDSQQERLKIELNFAGIQYLYKAGATIEDTASQISLDEAIIALACAQDDLSIIALTKRNVGALTEDISKTPYTLLFNGSTNSFFMYNSIQILRLVDAFFSSHERSSTGRRRLVLVHGNRYLLHCVLKEMLQFPDYSSKYYKQEDLAEKVSELCQDKWDSIYDAMEKALPDSYPANIFKNVGRLREIESAYQQ